MSIALTATVICYCYYDYFTLLLGSCMYLIVRTFFFVLFSKLIKFRSVSSLEP